MMAILGVLSMLAGAALITWGARYLSNGSDSPADSLLAPTLAVDTLDPDLRVLYMKTMVLDAQCEANYGAEHRDTWAPVGRELRRALVATQSRRVRGLPDTSAEQIGELMDRATEHVESGNEFDRDWEELREEVTRSRHA